MPKSPSQLGRGQPSPYPAPQLFSVLPLPPIAVWAACDCETEMQLYEPGNALFTLADFITLSATKSDGWPSQNFCQGDMSVRFVADKIGQCEQRISSVMSQSTCR